MAERKEAASEGGLQAGPGFRVWVGGVSLSHANFRRWQLGPTKPTDPPRLGDAEQEIGRLVSAVAGLVLPLCDTCLDGSPAIDAVGHGCLHSSEFGRPCKAESASRL
jgi:hypothetical protein